MAPFSLTFTTTEETNTQEIVTKEIVTCASVLGRPTLKQTLTRMDGTPSSVSKVPSTGCPLTNSKAGANPTTKTPQLESGEKDDCSINTGDMQSAVAPPTVTPSAITQPNFTSRASTPTAKLKQPKFSRPTIVGSSGGKSPFTPEAIQQAMSAQSASGMSRDVFPPTPTPASTLPSTMNTKGEGGSKTSKRVSFSTPKTLAAATSSPLTRTPNSRTPIARTSTPHSPLFTPNRDHINPELQPHESITLSHTPSRFPDANFKSKFTELIDPAPIDMASAALLLEVGIRGGWRGYMRSHGITRVMWSDFNRAKEQVWEYRVAREGQFRSARRVEKARESILQGTTPEARVKAGEIMKERRLEEMREAKARERKGRGKGKKEDELVEGMQDFGGDDEEWKVGVEKQSRKEKMKIIGVAALEIAAGEEKVKKMRESRAKSRKAKLTLETEKGFQRRAKEMRALEAEDRKFERST